MKTNKLFLGLGSLVMALVLFLTACNKSGMNAGSGNVAIFLTDGPGEYDSVFIDIQKVEVKIDNDSLHKRDDHHGDDDHDGDDHLKSRDEYGEWIDINYAPAVIDVLSLRNGVETKLGEANIKTGTVRKIRITLGTKNRVVKAGVSNTLELVNPTNNYLYVKLWEKHRQRDRGNATDSSNVKVWVDFDIANSIVEANGKFYLKPVLRPFCNENFGEVEGKVLPADAKAVVRISDGKGFNGVALPDRTGQFKLRGLETGTYTVTVEGIAPYIKQTISNVNVTQGKETDLGTITLKK